MIIKSGILAIFAAGFLSLLAASSALAQSGESEAGPQVPAYSESELKTFAVAALEVKRINDVYLPRVEAAQSQQEKEALVATAADEVNRVIAVKGMTTEQFMRILNDARADPNLADRVRQLIREIE